MYVHIYIYTLICLVLSLYIHIYIYIYIQTYKHINQYIHKQNNIYIYYTHTRATKWEDRRHGLRAEAVIESAPPFWKNFG